ncbi:MAG: PTO1314 family radical SAM protein [Thermoplasmataceae archaeon]
MSLLGPVVGRGIARTFRSIKDKKFPLIAGHKLQYSCNLKCKMCPFWRREDEVLLTVEDEIRMMESLKRAGVSFIGFEGGEPLLRRDIGEILYQAKKRFHTSMVTNGWLLKAKLPEIKDSINYLFVSLDGIGELHDKLRGMEGSYRRAIEGIEAASRYVPVSISSTITRDNMHQAEDMVKLASKLGITVNFQIAFDYSTAEAMSPEKIQLRDTVSRLETLKKEGSPIVNSVAYFRAILDSWYGSDPWRCKPWLTINIDPLGNVVQPCYVLNEYSGTTKVWDMDILKVWNTYDWAPYESCNKCALACYLEPSLFSWRNPTMVKERILDSVVALVKGQMAW